MSLKLKLMNAAGIVLPLAAVFCAIGMLWGRYVGMAAIVILAVGYVLTGLGITVGFHRLFTHRSFQTSPAMRYAVRGAGRDGGRIGRDHLGRRPPQAPPVLRPAGRPALARTPATATAWRDALHGLWHAHVGLALHRPPAAPISAATPKT